MTLFPKKKNSQWLDSKQLGKNDALVKLDKRTKDHEKKDLLIFSIKKAMISYNACFQSWILLMYKTHQLIFSITWFVIMRNYVDSLTFNMFQLMIRLLDLFLPRLYLSISFSVFVLFSLLVLRMISEQRIWLKIDDFTIMITIECWLSFYCFTLHIYRSNSLNIANILC
jgi:hypothetical protein